MLGPLRVPYVYDSTDADTEEPEAQVLNVFAVYLVPPAALCKGLHLYIHKE